MEYPQQAWLALWASILSAYILAGWIIVPSPKGGYATGEGSVTQNGFYSREINGKPYDSGDPRAGK